MASSRQSSEHLDLAQQYDALRGECRMVLPGIQALFGFQLIAVFSNGFAQELSHGEQVLHYVSLILVAIAAGLVMTPASAHRHHPERITAKLITLSSTCLGYAMIPLAIGISIDVMLIGRIVVGFTAGLTAGLAILAVLLWLWFGLARHR